MSFEARFEPVGRRVQCKDDDSILDAAQRAGIALTATCGGGGVCARCIVRVMGGRVSNPDRTEMDELGPERIDDGWRLACQTKVRGNVHIFIPSESLATAQRTQTEGRELPIALAPAVRAVEVELPPPHPGDPDPDTACLGEALKMPAPDIPPSILPMLARELRTNAFHVNLFLRGSSVVAVRPAGTPMLGLAVDLGTTKLAAYLVDLDGGGTLATAGAMNPQIAFGEDVMARISHAMTRPEGGEQLRAVVVEALNALVRDLCRQAGRSTDDIADAVVVGNTAMHHLFLGLPVSQLGVAPYVPFESAALDKNAPEVGLDLAPGANVHLLPNIAGFVGADHVAMLLGSGMTEREGTTLGLDIGTNTEISLVANGKHYACSTASGPAFEGAHIRHGMRAAPGAIEKVLIRDDRVLIQTVEDKPPIGLCGSGILDLVAQMRRVGLLMPNGRFDAAGQSPRLRPRERGLEFILRSVGENNGIEITFTQNDVSEIQLAKGAIRTGVQILLERAGVPEQAIDTVIIAGAFGTYLDVQSGIDIGMFPRLDKGRFIQVGNAAGAGARMALLSTEKREQAVRIARHVTYVELTSEKEFSNIFARSLLLK